MKAPVAVGHLDADCFYVSGNARGQSWSLPRTGWTWLSTIDEGGWQNSKAIPVDIPATLALERGIWDRVRQGIRGLLVPDERSIAVAYMIREPSTHDYRVMTRSDRMPVLIQERIWPALGGDQIQIRGCPEIVPIFT